VIVCEARIEDTASLQKEIMTRVSNDVGLPVADVVLLAPGTLPKTTSGKVQRRKTRELYADGSFSREGGTGSGEGNQTLQATGHLLRAMVSRFRHTVRNLRSES
jgi:hypothetical protein